MISEEQLATNLKFIDDRIQHACEKANRSVEDVKLIAVCKYVDAATTGKLVQQGCLRIGESRPQVLWEKGETLSDHNIEWHMIGHLQRNKVNRTLRYANWIHSIDSQRLLEAVMSSAQDQDKVVNCLLEVNISGESAKHGFTESELPSILELANDHAHVKIRGLMGMASLHGDAAANQNEFANLRKIRDRIQESVGDAFPLEELSMGMSGDFEAAIEEGATMIRLGSILFKSS